MTKVIKLSLVATARFFLRAVIWAAFGVVSILVSAAPLEDSDDLAAAHVVASRSGLPTRGHTWSLFLICNPSWLTSNRSADLNDLFVRFRAFGTAIGTNDHAIWFGKRGILDDSDRVISGDVDIERSVKYCRALSLRPSQGPYIVVFDKLPEIESMPIERAVFSVGKLTASELENILGHLTDVLVLRHLMSVEEPLILMRAAELTTLSPSQKVVDHITSEPPVWIRLLESTRVVMLAVGCRFSLQVKAGTLSAELKACK